VAAHAVAVVGTTVLTLRSPSDIRKRQTNKFSVNLESQSRSLKQPGLRRENRSKDTASQVGSRTELARFLNNVVCYTCRKINHATMSTPGTPRAQAMMYFMFFLLIGSLLGARGFRRAGRGDFANARPDLTEFLISRFFFPERFF
jgi:hypothetical protein